MPRNAAVYILLTNADDVSFDLLCFGPSLYSNWTKNKESQEGQEDDGEGRQQPSRLLACWTSHSGAEKGWSSSSTTHVLYA